MPWSEVTVQEKREEFVRLARQADANVSELCRRYGISRKTGYKWLGREEFGDRSRRPYSSPLRTCAQLEDKVLALRAKHPAWGGRKIAHVLMRDEGVQLAPSTANSVLRRHGLISPAASQASEPWQRFESLRSKPSFNARDAPRTAIRPRRSRAPRLRRWLDQVQRPGMESR